MVEKRKSIKTREIRNYFRFIPFGKFSLSGRGTPPYNQVFVGRKRERATLIEHLTHQEQFGAILVSGQRGAGKTAFVQECLKEYDRNTYQRAIRYTQARDLRGKFATALVALLFCISLMLLIEANELLAQNALETLFFRSLASSENSYLTESLTWTWLPLIGFSFAGIPLILYADFGFKAIAHVWTIPANFYLKRLGLWIAVALLLFIMFAEPFWEIEALNQYHAWKSDKGSSGLINFFSYLIYILIFLRFFESFLPEYKLLPPSRETKDGKDYVKFHRILCLIGIMIYFFLTVTTANIIRRLASEEIGIPAYLILSAILFHVIFYLSRQAFERMQKYNWLQRALHRNSEQANFYLNSIDSIFCFLFLFFAFLFSSGKLDQLNIYLTVPILSISVWFFIRVHRFNQLAKQKFQLSMRPHLFGGICVIFLKSLSVFAICLAILLPLLRVVVVLFTMDLDSNISEIGLLILDNLPSLEFSNMNVVAMLIMLVAVVLLYQTELDLVSRDQRSNRLDSSVAVLDPAHNVRQSVNHWHDLTQRRAELLQRADPEDRGYGTLEQSFSIPAAATYTNQDSSYAPLIDDPAATKEHSNAWMRRRHLFRMLEMATLPYLVYSTRFPTIAVWVNLGFDNLEHSRIVEAMLKQLRVQYVRQFLGFGTATGFANILMFCLASALLTSLIAKTLFNIGFVSGDYGREIRFQTKENGILPVYGSTNYCGFFEMNPAVSPNIKSLICALPASNAIIDFLYSPLLTLRTDFVGEGVALPRPSLEENSSKVEESSMAFDHGLQAWSIAFPKYPNRQSVEIREAFGGRIAESFLVRVFLDQNLGLPRLQTIPDSGLVSNRMVAYHPAFNQEAIEALELSVSDATQTDRNAGSISDNIFDETAFPAIELKGQPTLRTYHVLLYFLSFGLIFWGNSRLQITPYQAVVQRIDELLLLIRSQEIVKSTPNDLGGHWTRIFSFMSQERTVSSSHDPRIIEQNFIELLNSLRPVQSDRDSVFWSGGWLGVRPEITFVLDEMDKLSGIADAELSKDHAAENSVEENKRERMRSAQLHQLLSDMKRLISGGSARFIFIGGRLYHDEWLADKAQRAPILNAIFNGQIYLPSLLADRDHEYGRLNDRIAELVALMHRNAMHRYMEWRKVRRRRLFNLSEPSEEATYIQTDLPLSGHPRRFAALVQWTNLRVFNGQGEIYGSSGYSYFGPKNRDEDNKENLPDGRIPELISMGEQETLEQLINFLSYRSAGNPKKLKELLQEMIQPMSLGLAFPRRNLEDQTEMRWRNDIMLRGHDALIFDNTSLYRMQFIDVIYRHIADHMEGRMLLRDDKVSMSLFYLMDFLMKFHNRGFSWTNLHRVDELSHIHRAPDLRSVMKELVELSSQRFLHRVLNGVYSFRFRSDFAREIDYLSRQSKEEMAALNFTLDESQSLKGLYQESINTGERENADTISGLGELYEYDQEYEVARNYYRKAVSVLDQNMLQSYAADAVSKVKSASSRAKHALREGGVSSRQDEMHLSALGLLTSEDDQIVRRLVTNNLSWVVARLRLLLQIGHTYEQERNYERAAASFMHAAQISERVLQACNSNLIQDKIDDMASPNGRSVIPKTMAIFYQAALAMAWVKEKDPESIDESISYAEDWLAGLYAREYLLKPNGKKAPNNFQLVSSANLLLQTSTYHDRVGDLYFFKGKPSLRIINFEEPESSGSFYPGSLREYFQARATGFSKPGSIDSTDEKFSGIGSSRMGHSQMAHYHYALAFRKALEFLKYRSEASQTKAQLFGLEGNAAISSWSDSSVHPDLVQSVLSDCLSDLGESIISRLSPILLEVEVAQTAKLHRFSCTAAITDLNIRTVNLIYEIISKSIRQGVVDFGMQYINFGQNEKREGLIAKQLAEISKITTQNANTIDFSMALGKLADFLDINASKYDLGEGHTHIKSFLKPLQQQMNSGETKNWLGEPNLSAHDPIREPGLRFDGFSKPTEAVLAYKFFTDVGINTHSHAGYATNAAHELLQQADTLISMIWNSRILGYLSEDFTNPASARLKCRDKARKYFIPAWEAIKKASNINLSKDGDLHCTQIWRCTLASMALKGIERAFRQMQIAQRPSFTRMGQNHGNPAASDSFRFKDRELNEANPGHSSGASRSANEVYVDYTMAQAWRDNPRGITLTCSLILSILDPKSPSQFTIGFALKAYQDVLLKHAWDHFAIDENAHEKAPETFDFEPHKIIMEINETWRDLENSEKTIKIPSNQTELKKLATQLDSIVKRGLRLMLERYRFPVLNRLNGLKVMLDAMILNENHTYVSEQMQRADLKKMLDGEICQDSIENPNYEREKREKSAGEIGRLVRELLTTSEVYDSEMHFPPHLLGASLSLSTIYMFEYGHPVFYDDIHEGYSQNQGWPNGGMSSFADDKNAQEDRRQYYARSRRVGGEGGEWADVVADKRPMLHDTIITRESMSEAALNILRRSEQMFSQGNAYYENIAYMHYLNDDFNDRSIHANHAMNMMNAEITSVLASCIHSLLFHSD